MPDSKKFIFCSVYRVGNVGKANHNSIINTINDLMIKIQFFKKLFVVEKLFVDSFNELRLDQCIIDPTHIKGRTLDILLTNSKPIICNLSVLIKDSIYRSDHFPVTFEIKTYVKHQPIPKRKIYNFKKANWVDLNRKLFSTYISWWDAVINNKEPGYEWTNFKLVLFRIIDKFIPTITIKSTFSSP